MSHFSASAVSDVLMDAVGKLGIQAPVGLNDPPEKVLTELARIREESNEVLSIVVPWVAFRPNPRTLSDIDQDKYLYLWRQLEFLRFIHSALEVPFNKKSVWVEELPNVFYRFTLFATVDPVAKQHAIETMDRMEAQQKSDYRVTELQNAMDILLREMRDRKNGVAPNLGGAADDADEELGGVDGDDGSGCRGLRSRLRGGQLASRAGRVCGRLLPAAGCGCRGLLLEQRDLVEHGVHALDGVFALRRDEGRVSGAVSGVQRRAARSHVRPAHLAGAVDRQVRGGNHRVAQCEPVHRR